MSAEEVRLLHLVLDKMDRLADKGDEADWRAVAAIILEETRDANYHPRPARLREILAVAERHMVKGVRPDAELETTAEERAEWAKTQYANRQGNMITARLIRDHDRQSAEIARLTTELAEAQDKCRAWEVPADPYDPAERRSRAIEIKRVFDRVMEARHKPDASSPE